MFEHGWRETSDLEKSRQSDVDGPTGTQRPTPRARPKRFRIIAVMMLSGLLTTLVFFATFRSFEADGMSMAPAVPDGDRMLVNRLAYSQVDLGFLDGLPFIDSGLHWRTPERGNIIVFDSPVFRRVLVKRVVGLPGEVVSVRDGFVYIDGEELDEPYARGATRCRDDCRWVVPDDEYFVMGDNRRHSRDSRDGWTVPISDIHGQKLISY
jgi:signal peptidase I